MIIGIPKEIKNNENRVAMVVAGVRVLTQRGHKVLIQKGAGMGCAISDDDYRNAGAILCDSAKQVYKEADLVVKVKEPQSSEYEYLREGMILFTFLHLVAEPELARELLKKKVTSIAYETIQLEDGSLPVLTPMSEVAGRMGSQVGAHLLQKDYLGGGKGLLLGGIPGVRRGLVVVLGGGVAGLQAAKVALGLGAQVIILELDPRRMSYLEDVLKGSQTRMSNISNLEEIVPQADLLIGSVLIPGARAPKIVTKELVRKMEPGSVIIDISVDQGGCIETTHPTSHENPTYLVDGVIHYAVPNIPGVVARTSTYGLTNMTLPYVVKLADDGLERALSKNKALALGMNCHQGQMTHSIVARDLGLPYSPLSL